MSDDRQLTPPAVLRGKGWRQRFSVVLFVAGASFFFAWQFYSIQRAIWRAKLQSEPPVLYEELHPDKAEYRQGDLIHFDYVRYATVNSRPVLLLTIDSFENMETGEIFSGFVASRIVRESGAKRLRATRRVPIDATPGIYKFEGWAASQTNPPSVPAAYISTEFRVVASELKQNY